MASKSSFKFKGGNIPEVFRGTASKTKNVKLIKETEKIVAKSFRNRRIVAGLGLAALAAFFAFKAPREISSRRSPRAVGRPRSKRSVGRPKAKRRVGRPRLSRR